MAEENLPKRWSAKRKMEVVLRMLRGESLSVLSRELKVEISRLEQWRSQALGGMEVVLKERVDDPVVVELDRAKKRIGEMAMENELLKEKARRQGPLVLRRSGR